MSTRSIEEALPSRILSQNQDRTHKIQSVATEIKDYVLEKDFKIDNFFFRGGKYGEILHATDKKTGNKVVLKKMKRYVKNELIRSDIIK